MGNNKCPLFLTKSNKGRLDVHNGSWSQPLCMVVNLGYGRSGTKVELKLYRCVPFVRSMCSVNVSDRFRNVVIIERSGR